MFLVLMEAEGGGISGSKEAEVCVFLVLKVLEMRVFLVLEFEMRVFSGSKEF